MAGYRTQQWRLLKNEMNELWGADTQPLYTDEDLYKLCDDLAKAGDHVNSFGDFRSD
ncbi:uncharacterized protein MELLADRAFT_92619 [Melampsora larici-populina 98AG31]|uniref:Uncharacterized protein n=1 Tax=Melampsora larici-populina (strain 98AG31 / pathotype 3-4-7) TaxID=747676 RepID=F4S275_MELLP|nr:uncharacterized protein MELLADRAFT_92619 [Melampsora larici-populina 98AG31]EGG01252.1 hypothetical protein MELLADRAFT_92619 [Melampsora larici-populina 98AG31]